jgi:hypothetical protein
MLVVQLMLPLLVFMVSRSLPKVEVYLTVVILTF